MMVSYNKSIANILVFTYALLCLFLLSCIHKQSVEKNAKTDIEKFLVVNGKEFNYHGMHYAFVNNNGNIFIVNITKDSLECEYYRQNLNK